MPGGMLKVPSFNHIQERRTTVKTCAWLLSPLALLKIVVSVGLFVVVLFLMDGRNQWWPYTAIFIVDVFLVIYCLLSLMSHFFRISDIKFNVAIGLELLVNGLACLLSLLAFFVLAWDEWQMHDNHWGHHRRLPPMNIKQQGWMGRIAVVMVATLINSIVFLFIVLRVWVYGIE